MRPVREIGADEEDFRMERRGPFEVPRRDPIEPEPVGTIILMAFRIVGYDPDCDGSLMGRFEHIDRDGEPTGWDPKRIGVQSETGIVAAPGEWRALFGA